MPNNQSSMDAGKWRSTFTKRDLFTDQSDVQVIAGQFNLLGEYVVKAGETVALGYKDLDGQQDADGRIYMDLKDNSASPGANIEGVVQLAYYDANDHLKPGGIMDEFRTEDLRTNATDRTKQLAYPVKDRGVLRDRKIKLFFKPDAGGTVGYANSTVQINITKSTGI